MTASVDSCLSLCLQPPVPIVVYLSPPPSAPSTRLLPLIFSLPVPVPAAEAFRLLKDPSLDILAPLRPEQRGAARFLIIKCVLATDLAHGGKVTSQFTTRASLPRTATAPTDEDKLLLMQMTLKCADISHPARPWETHERWSLLVCEEFYQQGDRERRLGLPLSPLCDRSQHNLPKSQLGFLAFVVTGAYSALSAFCQYDGWMAQLRSNEARWRELAAAGATGSHMPTAAGGGGSSARSAMKTTDRRASASGRSRGSASARSQGAGGAGASGRQTLALTDEDGPGGSPYPPVTARRASARLSAGASANAAAGAGAAPSSAISVDALTGVVSARSTGSGRLSAR